MSPSWTEIASRKGSPKKGMASMRLITCVPVIYGPVVCEVEVSGPLLYQDRGSLGRGARTHRVLCVTASYGTARTHTCRAAVRDISFTKSCLCHKVSASHISGNVALTTITYEAVNIFARFSGFRRTAT